MCNELTLNDTHTSAINPHESIYVVMRIEGNPQAISTNPCKAVFGQWNVSTLIININYL